MLHLYHSPFSTCSQKVRLCLFEKALNFETTEIDFSRGDQLSPEYLAINPNGVVPTLVHDGQPIIESSVICEYLDEIFPQVQLSPDTALGRARMRAWLRYLEEVPTTAIRIPTFNKVYVQKLSQLSDEQRKAEADARPLRKYFYREMGSTGFSEQKYNESLERLSQTVQRMELALSKSRWLCGESLTLADICVVPTIDRMCDLGLSHIWKEAPAFSRWWNAIKERESFTKTYRPGSRVSEVHNIV